MEKATLSIGDLFTFLLQANYQYRCQQQ